MASIHDVARAAGVSTGTVSKAFRSPHQITEHTQQRVIEAAHRLNYQPRVRRPSPVSHRSGAIGAIGFEFLRSGPTDSLAVNPFYAAVLSGAEAEADALGLNLLVHTADRHSLEAEMPKMVREQAVGGMLLVGAADPAVVAAFAAQVPHIVLVDNWDTDGKFDSVHSDSFGGAFQATQYLLDLGHRRIGFVLSESDVSLRARRYGYQCALLDAGIVPNPSWIVYGETTDAQRAQVGTLLDAREPVTAIVGANDDSAVAALRACRERDLRIPEDVSVTGFDDGVLATSADPPLTTVRVDKEQMGRLGVRRLFERLSAPERTSTTSTGNGVAARHELPVSLVVRESCQAPPGAS